MTTVSVTERKTEVGVTNQVIATFEIASGLRGPVGQDSMVPGPDGLSVILQLGTTHIQWKFDTEGAEWQDLISIADITGADGYTPIKGVDYVDGIDGTNGQEISLQKTLTHIQWRLGTGSWTNLVALSELKGEKGDPGYTPIKGVDYNDGAPGLPGYTPVKDVDYFDGVTPIKGVDYNDGAPGLPGYTPQKNIDYFDGDPGAPGAPGLPGYTPVKDVDYFDGAPGAPGYTPIKDIDYFDGLSINWKGEWTLAVEYKLNDAVQNSGRSYICVAPHTATTTEELSDTLLWGMLADKGNDGAEGYTPVKDVDYFDGATGNGISTVALYSSAAPVDTYEITYTNGDHDYFDITNGIDGEDGTFVGTMDDITNGATYVKTENDLTDALKSDYDGAVSNSHASGSDNQVGDGITITGAGTIEDPFVSASTGSGQSLYHILVAPTDGDYTTLGAAIAAASAGDTIFVKSGTYNENTITTSLANLTVIGENAKSTIINLSTKVMTINGAGSIFQNICIQASTGGAVFGGDNQSLLDSIFIKSSGDTNYGLNWYGSYGKLTGNLFDDTTAADGSMVRFNMGGAATIITNNIFKLRIANLSGEGPVSFSGARMLVSNNQFISVSGSTSSAFLVTWYSTEGQFTSNTLYENGSVSILLYVGVSGTISTNTLIGGINGVRVNTGTMFVTVTGNIIKSVGTAAEAGILILANNTVATGNSVYGSSATLGQSSGIQVGNSTTNPDDCVVVGNRISRWVIGLRVFAYGSDNTIISGNNVSGNGAGLMDNGTNSITDGITAAQTVTLTNKRIASRVYTTTSTTTLTPEIATYDHFELTAQASDLNIANHSTSSPTGGEKMIIAIKSDATPRALTYGTNYVAKSGVALPTTTKGSKLTTLGFMWNAGLTKWVLIAVGEEA